MGHFRLIDKMKEVVSGESAIAISNRVDSATNLMIINDWVKQYGIFAIQIDTGSIVPTNTLIVNMDTLFPTDVVKSFSSDEKSKLIHVTKTVDNKCPAICAVRMRNDGLFIETSRFAGKDDMLIREAAQIPDVVKEALLSIEKLCPNPTAEIFASFLKTLMLWIGTPVIYN